MKVGQKTRDEMAEELAKRELENITDDDILTILMHGCKGWLEAHDLRQQYNHIIKNNISLANTIK
jgi:methyl coenzyme M reductase gamma subunit